MAPPPASSSRGRRALRVCTAALLGGASLVSWRGRPIGGGGAGFRDGEDATVPSAPVLCLGAAVLRRRAAERGVVGLALSALVAMESDAAPPLALRHLLGLLSWDPAALPGVKECFHFTLLKSTWQLNPWTKDFGLPVVEVMSPPDACVNACAAYVDPDSWEMVESSPSLTRTGSTTPGLRLALMSMLTNSIVIVSTTWMLMVVLVAAHMWHYEEDVLRYLRVQVQLHLCLCVAAQLLAASGDVARYGREICGPSAQHVSYLLVLGVCYAFNLVVHSFVESLAILFCVILLILNLSFWLLAHLTRFGMNVVVATLRTCLAKIVVDVEDELSLPSSCSNDGENLCAICLCPLHPVKPHVVRSPLSVMALGRLRPGFRTAASHMPNRTRLLRLVRCGHAFHAACLVQWAETASYGGSTCPTCRTEYAHMVWRWVPVKLHPLMETLVIDFSIERAAWFMLVIYWMFVLVVLWHCTYG